MPTPIGQKTMRKLSRPPYPPDLLPADLRFFDWEQNNRVICHIQFIYFLWLMNVHPILEVSIFNSSLTPANSADPVRINLVC
jgi:hypothetical protein